MCVSTGSVPKPVSTRTRAFGLVRLQCIGLWGLSDGGLGRVLEVKDPCEFLALLSQLPTVPTRARPQGGYQGRAAASRSHRALEHRGWASRLAICHPAATAGTTTFGLKHPDAAATISPGT